MSHAMVYKGQVPTYADLPDDLTPDNTGWTYNVVDTGNNYAWNGTGWDNMMGEYVAGAGIVINGKVISATGISFVVGDGLQATGAGTSTTLKTRNALGLEYANVGTTETPILANQVKKGSGITVNASGVNVNTGETTQLVNDDLEVKPYQGVENTSDGLSAKLDRGLTFTKEDPTDPDETPTKIAINANFTEDPTPLGDAPSNITRYSDGKIGIKLEDVKIEGALLYEYTFLLV